MVVGKVDHEYANDENADVEDNGKKDAGHESCSFISISFGSFPIRHEGKRWSLGNDGATCGCSTGGNGDVVYVFWV